MNTVLAIPIQNIRSHHSCPLPVSKPHTRKGQAWEPTPAGPTTPLWHDASTTLSLHCHSCQRPLLSCSNPPTSRSSLPTPFTFQLVASPGKGQGRLTLAAPADTRLCVLHHRHAALTLTENQSDCKPTTSHVGCRLKSVHICPLKYPDLPHPPTDPSRCSG